MVFLAWNVYLATGYPEIDQQHQELIEIIHQFLSIFRKVPA